MKRLFNYLVLYVKYFYIRYKINKYFMELNNPYNSYNIGHTLFIKEIISLNTFMKSGEKTRHNPNSDCIEEMKNTSSIFSLIKEIENLTTKIEGIYAK